MIAKTLDYLPDSTGPVVAVLALLALGLIGLFLAAIRRADLDQAEEAEIGRLTVPLAPVKPLDTMTFQELLMYLDEHPEERPVRPVTTAVACLPGRHRVGEAPGTDAQRAVTSDTGVLDFDGLRELLDAEDAALAGVR